MVDWSESPGPERLWREAFREAERWRHPRVDPEDIAQAAFVQVWPECLRHGWSEERAFRRIRRECWRLLVRSRRQRQREVSGAMDRYECTATEAGHVSTRRRRRRDLLEAEEQGFLATLTPRQREAYALMLANAQPWPLPDSAAKFRKAIARKLRRHFARDGPYGDPRPHHPGETPRERAAEHDA